MSILTVSEERVIEKHIRIRNWERATPEEHVRLEQGRALLLGRTIDDAVLRNPHTGAAYCDGFRLMPEELGAMLEYERFVEACNTEASQMKAKVMYGRMWGAPERKTLRDHCNRVLGFFGVLRQSNP